MAGYGVFSVTNTLNQIIEFLGQPLIYRGYYLILTARESKRAYATLARTLKTHGMPPSS